MSGSLATTNLLLAIMTAVSVLEALLVIGIGVAGVIVYRRAMDLLAGIEARQLAPAMARVNAILDDAKAVTGTVREETERVDHAIRSKTSRLVGLIRGARVAIGSMFRAHHPHESQP